MYLTMCPHAELHLSSCIKPYVDDEGEVHEGRAKKKDQTTPPKKKKKKKKKKKQTKHVEEDDNEQSKPELSRYT